MLKKLITTALALSFGAAAQAATYNEGFEGLSGLNSSSNNNGAIANQDPGVFEWTTDNINNLQLLSLPYAASAKNLNNINSAANQAQFGNWVGYLQGLTTLSFAPKTSAGFTAFDLASIDFYTRSANTIITFSGVTTGGQTVTDSFSMLAANQLYTYTDPFNKFGSVVSLSFSGNQVAFDNVSVASLDNVGPVPEPSSWLMLLAGVCMVGFIARRRCD